MALISFFEFIQAVRNERFQRMGLNFSVNCQTLEGSFKQNSRAASVQRAATFNVPVKNDA